MWSSLSSYLYNDTADDGGESRQATHRPPTPRSRATSHRDERHIIEHPHTSRGGSRPISLQTSLHSTTSSTNSGGSANKQRHVSTPKASSATNTTILRGIIVGEEQSGKTSLIRRLRGEDPFLHYRNEYQEQLDDGSDSRRKKRNVMALLPWKVPEQTPFQQKHPHTTLDAEYDVVQLYISEGKSFCYTNKERPFHKQWTSILQSHKGKECNFVVWMLDPSMDSVLGYLQEGLDVLFPPSSTVQDENENDEIAKEQKVKQQPLIQNLCILLNFRDLNLSQQKESKSLVDQVQQIVNTVIERNPEPTILVYESSMKNCFGLQHLHSFITLPYLSHKEQELRRRAENARKQHTQWKKGLEESKVMQYTDFIKQRAEQQKKQAQASTPRSKQSLEHQRLVEEKEKLQRRLQQQNQMLQAKAARQEQSNEDEVGSPSSIASRQRQMHVSASPLKQIGNNEPAPAPLDDTNTTGQRKLFVKSQPEPKPQQQQQQPAPVKKAPPTPQVVEHTNLDSFFSDDEEDDVDSVGNVSSESSNEDDDEDSDDEDFFIDGTGTRRAHANVPPVSYKQRNTKQKEKKPIAKTPGPIVKSQSNKDQCIFSKEDDKLSTPLEQPPSQPDQKVQASKKVDKSDQVMKPTDLAPAGGAVKNDEGPISSGEHTHHTDKGMEEPEKASDETPDADEEPKVQSVDDAPKDGEGVGSENEPETLGDGNTREQPSPPPGGSKAPVPIDPNSSQGISGNVEELQTGVSSSNNTNESKKQDDTVSRPPSSSRDQKQIERGKLELENIQDADMNIDELGEGIGSANKSTSADDNKVDSEKGTHTKAQEQATLSPDCSKAIVEDEVSDGKSETNTTEDESASSSNTINESKKQDDIVSTNESEKVQAQLPEAPDENNASDGSLGKDDPSNAIENVEPVVEDGKPLSDNGDGSDGSQDMPSSKTDSPSHASSGDAEKSEQADTDAEHRDAEADGEAGETLSSTEAVDTEGQPHTKQQVQNEAVLDSDDDSTDGSGEGGPVKQKNQSHVEDDESDEDLIIDAPYKSSVETPLKPKDDEEKSEDEESDEELIIDAPKAAASHLPAEIPLKSKEDEKKPTANSPPVSSAALAAIEAAKREAEQMMAQSQTIAAPRDGKLKKSKKEKKAKREKRKKKTNR